MKYFGQYLVEKQMISEEVLVDSLIEQVAELPTMLELVRKRNLLKTSVLLEVFARQTEGRREFKEACRELGVWSTEIEVAIQEELESIRVPLGRLLVAKGALDLATLTRALDDFLSRIESVPEGPRVDPAPASSSPLVSDPIPLDEFVSYLSDARLASAQSLFVTLKLGEDDADMAIPVLKELLVEFRSLKELLRFVQLPKTEALISRVDSLLVASLERVARGDFKLVSALSDAGERAIELLGELRQALARERNEDAWFEDPVSTPKAEDLIGRLDQLAGVV